MVVPPDGGQARGSSRHRGAHLEGPTTAPPSTRALQAKHRSPLRGEAAGRGRPLPQSPEHALALSVDGKTQIQALDRTQSFLPLRPGVPERQTHDYRRNGTTDLLAALDVVERRINGECHKRHRAREFLAFLGPLDRSKPTELDLHLVLDNLSTHKTPEVKRWLLRHPRFYFVPAVSSWLNQVERWFKNRTYRQIRRGKFRGERDQIDMLKLYIEGYNDVPRPFQWRASADENIVKDTRNRISLGIDGTGH